MSKRILYILSPSYASYIQSKSILKELVDNGFNVDLLIPKPNGYSLLISKLPEIINNLKVKKFLIQTNPLNPFYRKYVDVNEIKNITKEYKFNFQLKIGIFLNKLRIRFIPNSLTNLICTFIRFSNSFAFVRSQINRFNNMSKWDLVIYDVNEENKIYFISLIPLIYSCKRIHISHGYDISSTHFSSKKIWIYKENLIITLYSGKEKCFYKWIYSLKDNNFRIIGLPNHQLNKSSKEEGESLSNKLIDKNNLGDKVEFILLASRPPDNINYCNYTDRKNYLKTIGKFIIANQKYFLLIKKHPKEKEISKNYWSNELGLKDNINCFCLVENEMEILAKICKFGISFYSGSCIDFAFNKKPILEMSSPENTILGDLTIHFDAYGRPESSYSHNNLTLSVKNVEELKSKLENIDERYNLYAERLHSSYLNCYPVKYTFNKVLAIINE